MDKEPIFQGLLGAIHFPDLLTFLDMLGRTGTLEVSRGEASKRIYWDRGEIVFADSSLATDRIPEFLCRNGEISLANVTKARAAAVSEKDVISGLIRSGALEPATLPRAVKDLVLDIVYSLFEWDEGSFRFVLTEDAHPERLPLRTSVANAIVEGCRRIDEWRRIREHLPSDDVFPVRSTADPRASLRLAPSDEEVLAFVDGRTSVADLVFATSLDHFSTLSSLLTLKNAGLVTLQAQPIAEPPAQEPLRAVDGLADAELQQAETIVGAFNNMFAGIHSRIRGVKGPGGVERFAATLRKASFQRGGVFDGVEFDDAGRIDTPKVIRNVARLANGEKIVQLKGSLDRLLAQQVVQLDTSYPASDKQAISELISAEKGRLPTA